MLLLDLCWGCDKRPQSTQIGQSPQAIKTVSLDDLAEYPETFTGTIAVTGRVAKTDAASKVFTLGCEDACLNIPVKFSGELPTAGSIVIVQGQLERTEQGRFVLNAQDVKPK